MRKSRISGSYEYDNNARCLPPGMPAMMGMLPGVELSAKTALIPILNVCLACKEMLSGVWHWGYLAMIFGSTAVVAAGAIGLCVWMFNREGVMFRA